MCALAKKKPPIAFNQTPACMGIGSAAISREQISQSAEETAASLSLA